MFPPKEAVTKSWHALCVDPISKCKDTPKGGGKKFQILPKGDKNHLRMTSKSVKFVYLQAVTMIGLD